MGAIVGKIVYLFYAYISETDAKLGTKTNKYIIKNTTRYNNFTNVEIPICDSSDDLEINSPIKLDIVEQSNYHLEMKIIRFYEISDFNEFRMWHIPERPR